MSSSTAAFSMVIAVDDPTRSQPHAVTMARRLVADTSVALHVMSIAAHGDRTSEIVDRLARREGALVVMDAHGGGSPGDVLFDEDVESALEQVVLPIVVMGPCASVPPTIDTLVVAIDEQTPVATALEVVVRWSAAFGRCDVVVVHLEAPSSWPGPDVASDPAAVDALAALGISGSVEVIVTLEPWQAVCDAAADHPNAVLVLTTMRWPGSDHWFSTVRRVIRHVPCPVLVVPADW